MFLGSIAPLSKMTKGAHGRWRYHRYAIWLFNNRIRFLMGLSVLLGLFVLASRVSSLMGWQHHKYEWYSPYRQERFTVVINTWRRPDLLKKSVQHYSHCPNVDAIHVVWSESKDPPSDALLSDLRSSVKAASRKLTHTIKLKIDMHDEDNLNTRFKPLDDLATDGIFSVDDDVVVPCDTLTFAFTVWSSARDTMVGFVPRMHWVQPEPNQHRYLYGGWWSVWWTGTYSMVLSKCAFLHRKYLDLYSSHMPARIRDFVTRERNCEDIAMSFLVANATGGPPIWVKGKLFEIGTTGISSLIGHSQIRTACLNEFVDMYGHMPLVPSNVKAMDARTMWFW